MTSTKPRLPSSLTKRLAKVAQVTQIVKKSGQREKLNKYLKNELKLDLVAKKRLGKGAFGRVYTGTYNGREVAIKVDRHAGVLNQEAAIYQRLQDPQSIGGVAAYSGLPSCLLYVNEKKHRRVMVLPMMGENLEKLMHATPKDLFSPLTTMVIAYQLLSHFKFIHGQGIIHKDIKPENIVLMSSAGSGRSLISLLDFGLAKRYVDDQGKLYPNRKRKSFDGTPLFIGINAQEKESASRRDDLQALAYTLIYFLRGRLPWENLHRSGGGRSSASATSVKEIVNYFQSQPQLQSLSSLPSSSTSMFESFSSSASAEFKINCRCRGVNDSSIQEECQSDNILMMKKRMPHKQLCHGLLPVFREFLDYTMCLQFDETPNYDHWRQRFFTEARTLSLAAKMAERGPGEVPSEGIDYSLLDWNSE